MPFASLGVCMSVSILGIILGLHLVRIMRANRRMQLALARVGGDTVLPTQAHSGGFYTLPRNQHMSASPMSTGGDAAVHRGADGGGSNYGPEPTAPAGRYGAGLPLHAHASSPLLKAHSAHQQELPEAAYTSKELQDDPDCECTICLQARSYPQIK